MRGGDAHSRRVAAAARVGRGPGCRGPAAGQTRPARGRQTSGPAAGRGPFGPAAGHDTVEATGRRNGAGPAAKTRRCPPRLPARRDPWRGRDLRRAVFPRLDPIGSPAAGGRGRLEAGGEQTGREACRRGRDLQAQACAACGDRTGETGGDTARPESAAGSGHGTGDVARAEAGNGTRQAPCTPRRDAALVATEVNDPRKL